MEANKLIFLEGEGPTLSVNILFFELRVLRNFLR